MDYLNLASSGLSKDDFQGYFRLGIAFLIEIEYFG